MENRLSRLSKKDHRIVYRPAGGAGFYAGRRLRLGGKRMETILRVSATLTSFAINFCRGIETQPKHSFDQITWTLTTHDFIFRS